MKIVKRIALLVVVPILVGAVMLVPLGLAQKEDTNIPAGVPGKHVVVDGVPLRYIEGGAGPDLLLVHGSPGSVEDWDPIFTRLAEQFHVVACDRIGHGYSGGDGRPHTGAENARMTMGLIRALGLKDVTIVGHSYGGLTALTLAVDNPPELHAIVVVGSRAYRPVDIDPLYKILALPVVGKGLAAALSPLAGSTLVEEGLKQSFGPNVDRIPPGFIAMRTPLWTRPTVTAALSQERATFEASLAAIEPRYKDIRKPTTLLYGEQDKSFTDSRRLAQEIPNARLITFPNTGHYVHFAHPDEVIAAIVDTKAAPAP